jgi:hypothetical protein
MTRVPAQELVLRDAVTADVPCLRFAQSEVKADGASTLWLTAWVGNERARRFYAARGYVDQGATTCAFDGESSENRLYARQWR